MADEKTIRGKKNKRMQNRGAGGGIYGLGFIGSLVYFIQNSDTFWMGVLGVLKAMVWPAFLIHKIFEILKI